LVDVVEQANRDILVDTSWADVGGVETGTRNSFIEFLVCILVPFIYSDDIRHRAEINQYLTMSFSLSSKPHRKGVRAPTSIA